MKGSFLFELGEVEKEADSSEGDASKGYSCFVLLKESFHLFLFLKLKLNIGILFVFSNQPSSSFLLQYSTPIYYPFQ